MTQPNMPNLPGFDAMADTMEFVKNMWGGMKAPAAGIPGMVMPTLSVEEINKQIADLKAVEAWLNANMTMLRGTIQALEVQSATISTLRTMGETFGANMQGSPATHPAAASASVDPLQASAASAAASTAWWTTLQEQFNQTVSSVMSEENAVQKKTKPQAAQPKTTSTAAKKTAAKSAAKPRKKRTPAD
ncbi:PhaM family polyhydroxyalkanoate granule multifunctional regulatory protein [Herminiimonas arsenitoxidans]|uniref:PhaM family polyhydroxyalkanoate granule multifunctional regulatory protein n=1 Tax=Herminiimonas arsenitoxidans TaxID=1809410 RepID=UPI0009F987E8|nr:PhaM family polyhydroxyalkanoate granule multifunctional regulatory protein [Herminiimonas arsenitoxidans]